MWTIGLGLGGLLVFIGMVVYFLAPRVGPNPIFGVRVGYSYASREVWDQTNRVGGGLFVLVGIGVAVLGMLLQLFNLPLRDGINFLIVVMIIALLVSTAWMFAYARNLAKGTDIAREIVPVRFRWSYVAPVFVTFIMLVIMGALIYPDLPADRLATHFNIYEQPDGWMSRDEFYITFLGMALLFVILNLLIVSVATREPLIAFGRWGMNWRLEPGRGLIYSGIGFALAILIFIAVMWDLYWFNTRGVHAFPLSLLFWILIPLIAILIALFFILGKRETKTSP